MKVLVPMKRVVDYNVQVQVKPDHSGVNTEQVKMSMNPFDEIALEQAVRMHEQQEVEEIVAISIGPPETVDILRHALAMGAHKAVLVDAPAQQEPLCIAKTLVSYAKRYEPDLILMGKQAIDDDCNQTGQMLAQLLGWPQATFASKIVATKVGWDVTREVDEGLETIRVTKPCVITTDLRLNTPRYITLPNIIRAKQKPLEQLSMADLGIEQEAKLQILSVHAPSARKKGVVFDDVDEWLKALKEDGVI